MYIQVASVRDAKTEIFSQPMFFPTKGVAIRSFMDEVQRQGSNLSAHPEDYSLWSLGVFDDVNGTFECLPAPERLCLAIDLKKE